MFSEIRNHTEWALQFEAVAVIDEKIAYAAGYQVNGLFKIDLMSGECEYLKSFPDFDIWSSRLFYCAVQGKNGIYFSPAAADYIAVYYTHSGEISRIPILPMVNVNKQKKHKFGAAFCYHENVYFVGATCGYVLKLNENTGQISVINLDIHDKYFFRKGILVEDSFYIASVNSPVILEYRLETDTAVVHRVGNDGGSWSICYAGDKFWLPPRAKNDPVLCWDKNMGTVKPITVAVANYKPQDANFLKAFCIGNKVIFTPECANMFIQIDARSGVVGQLEVPLVDGAHRYGVSFESNRYIYLSACMQNGKIYDFKLDKETLKAVGIQFELKNPEVFEAAVKNALDCEMNHFFMKENKLLNLSEFIALVQLKDANGIKEDTNTGRNIWNCIKETS